MRPPEGGRAGLDLRVPLLAVVAWAAALVAPWVVGDARADRIALAGAPVLLLLVGVLAAARRGRRDAAATGVGVLVVALAVGAVAGARDARLDRGPVADLAAEGASVHLTLDVTGDPRLVQGRFGAQVLVRARVVAVSGRGRSWRERVPVLVLTSASGAEGGAWLDVPLGARVRAAGLLAEADRRGPGEPAALLRARGAPRTLRDPGSAWDAAAAVRASLRASVAHRPPAERVLVPALVAGDDRGLDPHLAEDFRSTGLTHLTAVSGTNLTLVVGFLLVLARWAGARGRWLAVVAGLGIVGFVLLARTEPSVVRAAAMGTVALVALGGNGRHRGLRALGVAVLALLLVDPGLAGTAGFALSVSATGGILLLAPAWRDALGRWLPRWLAEAIAVPATAQLACTPLVAGLSGQVSLVAVLANLLVAPAVGPATVLGLAGGLIGLAWEPAGRVPGTLAAWCVGWVVRVARWGADLPQPTVDWGTTLPALLALTVVCLALGLLAPRVLGRRRVGPAALALLVAGGTVHLPASLGDALPGLGGGWPGPDWVLAACDVGQGDALVLRAAPATAVVVDAGPEPDAVDACLRRLGVRRVPLVVLTHFHADHVAGLPGVLAGREVGSILTSPLPDPTDGARAVAAAASAAGVPVAAARAGSILGLGQVSAEVVWPPATTGRVAAPGDGSAANDASVVLLVEARGLRLLLTGDVEPPAQAGLRRVLAGQRVDVLKVPHHGSPHQDLDWLTSLQPRAALVSVGADNDYGHPSPSVLAALERSGARVLRTDTAGPVAVAVGPEGEPMTRVAR